MDTQTYSWNGERWLLNGLPMGLPQQILLSKAYLAELRVRAGHLTSEQLVKECGVLRDLACTDPNMLESALDFCSGVLQQNPQHKGARAVHMSILMKLAEFDRPGRWN